MSSLSLFKDRKPPSPDSMANRLNLSNYSDFTQHVVPALNSVVYSCFGIFHISFPFFSIFLYMTRLKRQSGEARITGYCTHHLLDRIVMKKTALWAFWVAV